MKFDKERFSKDIKVRRTIDNDFTLREAAKISGVQYTTLSRFENGKMPDLLNYVRICKWLGCKMEKYFKQ